MSDEKLNLLQRLNEVRKKVTYIQKAGRGQNDGASHWDIIRKVRPAMVEFGIAFFPVGVEVISSSCEPLNDEKPTKWSRMLCKYTFRVANIDDPEDFQDIIAISEGLDNSDKAPGKAATYAAKTAIIQLFNFEIGTDPDLDPIDLDPELDADRIERIERLKKLAAELEPDDPESVVIRILTYFGKKHNRVIKNVTGMPVNILDQAIEMVQELIDKAKGGNGQAPKPEDAKPPIDDGHTAIIPGPNAPRQRQRKRKWPTTEELRFKELQCIAMEKTGMHDLDAEAAIKKWLGNHKKIAADLADAETFKTAKAMLEELTETDWDMWIPEPQALSAESKL